jgi:zinc transport system permease protein
MQNALLASLLIAILCPCIGIFLVLRKFSLIGDTLAHASLAGVALGLFTGVNPILGAFVFTSVCGALIEFLRGAFRKHTDLILSVVMSLGVGVAITLISSGKLRAGADAFLFGSILTVTRGDLALVAALSLVAVLTVGLLYHRLLYIAYDEDAAQILGVRVKLINYVFSVLVACAISVSIRLVGVLVLSSMISLPVAAAIQLGRGFKVTLLASIAFSLADILLGLAGSTYLGVAPGGFTALAGVAVLLVVIVGKHAWRKTRRRRAG